MVRPEASQGQGGELSRTSLNLSPDMFPRDSLGSFFFADQNLAIRLGNRPVAIINRPTVSLWDTTQYHDIWDDTDTLFLNRLKRGQKNIKDILSLPFQIFPILPI